MFPENSYGHVHVTNQGSLQIRGVQKDDAGYYICSALSVAGSDTIRAFLQVTSVDDIPPPIIQIGPTNQTLPKGSVASLPCKATGKPVPRIKWSRNGAQLQLSQRFQLVQGGTLRIDGEPLSGLNITWDSCQFPYQRCAHDALWMSKWIYWRMAGWTGNSTIESMISELNYSCGHTPFSGRFSSIMRPLCAADLACRWLSNFWTIYFFRFANFWFGNLHVHSVVRERGNFLVSFIIGKKLLIIVLFLNSQIFSFWVAPQKERFAIFATQF